MIRESLTGTAKNAFMAVRPVITGTAGGNIFSSRSATNGTTTLSVANNSQGVPSWLKLVRSGSTFTGYSSTDGTTWTQNGTATIAMSGSAYIGFTVTCSSTSGRATAQFDNISITGTTPTLTSISVLPTSSRMEPGSAVQFTATAKDQFGNALTPQPTFTWNASGGGTVDSNGLFTSGTTIGGPFTVTASSAGVSGTSAINVSSAPNAPTGLTITPATMSPGWLQLNWTDKSNCETGFTIVQVQSGGIVVAGTTGPNVTTWKRTGLSMPSGPYTYQVYASGAGGLDSAYTASVTGSISTPPNGPAGLTATPGNAKVTLSWNPVSGASNYNISRSVVSGSSYSVIKYNNSGTTYTDSAVTIGTTYYYVVNYNTSAGGSLNSAEAAATPVGPLATIAVAPASSTVTISSTQQFSAVGKDSLGANVIPQPIFAWSVSGGGAIGSTGLFSAGTQSGGPYTVTAASAGISGTASVRVSTPVSVFENILGKGYTFRRGATAPAGSPVFSGTDATRHPSPRPGSP